MSKLQLLNGGQPSNGADLPEGVSFDGSTDYLSRSSDLVGNVDSKTFTFSCWVYKAVDMEDVYPYSCSNNDSNYGFRCMINNAETCYFQGYNNTNQVLNISCQTRSVPNNTWVHILGSIDMYTQANCKIYINDVSQSLSFNVFSTGIALDFTRTHHFVNNLYYLTGDAKCRLSHLFLDYNYRDLSIEANRRLFITADGKPADGLASLNPILYLPMKDASTAHINEGTGGDFVQNGTLATADRGANQDNCVQSKFDWVDDSLTVSTGWGTSSEFTISGIIYPYATGDPYISFGAGTSTTVDLMTVQYDQDKSRIAFSFYDTSGAVLHSYSVFIFGSVVDIKNYATHFSASIDLSNSSNSIFYINGTEITPTINNSNNGTFNMSKIFRIGMNGYNGTQAHGYYGEVYFDTNYIDLATNNPFWDSETNKPIPVRTAMETLGSNPLICMPIDASNPTKNYGSGGDFTLNGGGLVGARGMSEYIARSVEGNGYLYKNSNLGMSDGKTFSLVLPLKTLINGSETLFSLSDSTGDSNFRVKRAFDTGLEFYALNDSHTTKILDCVYKNVYILNEWSVIFVYCDVSTSTLTVYANNLPKGRFTTTINNDSFNFSNVTKATVKGSETGNLTGNEASVYFTTDYIDFSQESNRNLFVNQLGYPRDLTPEIEAGNIPTPLIYLPFDDPSNLGKNLGTGGDFVVNGTVTAGADFSL